MKKHNKEKYWKEKEKETEEKVNNLKIRLNFQKDEGGDEE